MSPQYSPSPDEFHQASPWETALQEVSFSWTDPASPLKRETLGPDDAEDLLNQVKLVHGTFEYIMANAPDLAVAANRCLSMIERTSGESQQVRESVKIWFHLALVGEVVDRDTNEHFQLFLEEIDERYYRPFAAVVEQGLEELEALKADDSHLDSDRSDESGAIVARVRDYAKETMNAIEGLRTVTLRQYPEFLAASIDRVRLYSDSLSQQDLADYAVAIEPEKRAIFMEEVDLKTKEYRQNLQKTCEAFASLAKE